MSTKDRATPFAIGFLCGIAAIVGILFTFPRNGFYRSGYHRGVSDCQAGTVQVKVDSTLVIPEP